MKRIPLFCLALLLCWAPGAFAGQGVARITLPQGDVQVRMADSNDWVPAAPNTPLEEGDSVWSPDGSRAEIQFSDGTYIRLDARTSLDILENSDSLLQVHLGMGRAYVRTGSPTRTCQVDLTESTVSVNDRARLRFDITAEGDEDISVIRGSAYVEGYGTRTRVRSGEMLSMEENRSEVLPLNPPDEWDRWNRQRDQQLTSAASAGYLPEELRVYENELSTSGEWVAVPEYGRIWRPTVIVTNDWAPYREGRWVWRDGDYVWVSHESWGWVPYHYGRWVVLPRWGWCWVPPSRGDVYWAPAYVGWVTTPGQVGWVPLAPGEIYYGRGYHGGASVNITNVTNITTVNVTRIVYRNQTVTRNAITVVPRDSFNAGKMTLVKPKENFMARASVSRPAPPATRAVRMPLVKPIPASKLPPPAVAAVPARELKHRLPPVAPGGERGRQQAPSMRTGERPATVPRSLPPAATPRTEHQTPAEHRDVRRPVETRQLQPGSQIPPSNQTVQPPRREPAPPVPARRESVAPAPGQAPAPARGPAMERRHPRNVWKVKPQEGAPARPAPAHPEKPVPREKREQRQER